MGSGRSGEAIESPRAASRGQSLSDASGSPSSTDHPRRGHAFSDSHRDRPAGSDSRRRSSHSRPRTYADDPRSSHNDPRSYSNDPRSTHNSPRSYHNDPRSYPNDPRSYPNDPRSYSNDRKEHRIATHNSINAMDHIHPEHTRNHRARTPPDKRGHAPKPHAHHNRHRPQALPARDWEA